MKNKKSKRHQYVGSSFVHLGKTVPCPPLDGVGSSILRLYKCTKKGGGIFHMGCHTNLR